MSQKVEISSKCGYCWHPDHGKTEDPRSFTVAAAMVSTTEKNRCHEIVDTSVGSVRECNCDGRSQWFMSALTSLENALEWARLAETAGYTIYVFNQGDIVVNPINPCGEFLDGKMSCVFSETLPPVASRQEFEDRCQMPAHLRWPTEAKDDRSGD